MIVLLDLLIEVLHITLLFVLSRCATPISTS